MLWPVIRDDTALAPVPISGGLRVYSHYGRRDNKVQARIESGQARELGLSPRGGGRRFCDLTGATDC